MAFLPDNIEQAIKQCCLGVDLNSGVETAAGVKDSEKVRSVLRRFCQINLIAKGSIMQRTALVTGATAGFGAAICHTLIENGYRVIGTGRRVASFRKITARIR